MPWAKNRATLALAGLVGVAPLLCWRGNYDPANLPQSAWIAVVGWFWLAGCLWGARVHGSRPPTVVLVVLLWAGLSLIWAEGSEPGWRLWLHWLSCAAIGLGARSLWRAPSDAMPALAALAASGACVAGVGLAQHFLGFDYFPQAIAPAATFVNKNVGAGFVVLVWPLTACLWRGRRLTWPNLAVSLALGFQALYLFVAFSRAAWLAVTVQLLAVSVSAARRCSRGQRFALVTVGLALVGLVSLGGVRLPGAAGDAVEHLRAAGRALNGEVSDDRRMLSVSGRMAIWANTLAMVRERPVLGVGLGDHSRRYPRYAHAARPDPLFSAEHQLDFVHNDFLQVAAEQGLLGLACWAAMLALALRALWSRFRQGTHETRRMAAAVGLTLIGLCVDAGFGFPLERALPPLVVALGLAFATVPAGDVDRRAPRAFAWAALLVAVGLSTHFVRRLEADRRVSEMFAARARGDLATARHAAERALELDSAAFPAAFALGRISLDQRQPADALRWLDRALHVRPLDPATLGTRAEAFGTLGDLDRAVADARSVAQLLGRDGQAWYELGRWLERAGRPAEAREAYREACALAPSRADFQLRLAVTAQRSGARELALQSAQAALRLAPQAGLSALAHKLLGLLLLDQPDRRAEGLAHLRTALALDPQLSDAARLRALTAESPVRP